MVSRPGSRWITGSVHGQVGPPFCIRSIDEENGGEPGIGRLIKIAARVACKLLQPFSKKDIDIEWASNHRTISTIDCECRVHRLYYETVASTQTLVRRLKFRSKVGIPTIAAADTVEVLKQPRR